MWYVVGATYAVGTIAALIEFAIGIISRWWILIKYLKKRENNV